MALHYLFMVFNLKDELSCLVGPCSREDRDELIRKWGVDTCKVLVPVSNGVSPGFLKTP